MTRRPRRLVVRRSHALELGAPTRTPLDAAVLCIDAAKRSGCALYVRGRLCWYGTVDAHSHDERSRVLRVAQTEAPLLLPLGAVVEATFGGYASAALSLQSTLTLWRDSWTRCALPAQAFCEVTVGEWRRALFGRRALSRTAARELERNVAHAAARRDMPAQRHHTIDADSCAAICIGQVVTRSSGLCAALGCGLVTSERTAT